MHTQNVNVKSAGEETAGRCDQNTCLTDRQIIDLFNWVFAATDDIPGAKCHDFTPPADAEELNGGLTLSGTKTHVKRLWLRKPKDPARILWCADMTSFFWDIFSLHEVLYVLIIMPLKILCYGFAILDIP
jgi:hypothetical protein